MTLVTILLTFLKLHWLDVLLVLIFLAVLAWLWKIGRRKAVIRIIRNLVAKAEQAYGSKTGPIKWNAVYASLPWLIRTLWTPEEIDQLIKDAVKWLDDQLAKAEANLLTYAEEVIQLETKTKNSIR